MRLLRTTGVCAALLAGATACADLSVTNTNQPDQDRVIATPLDMENVVGSSYLTLFYAYTWQTDLVLSAASFQHSVMAANLGMIQMSKIPREPINNTTSDAYVNTYEEIWYGAYAAIKPAVDGLIATDPSNPDGYQIVDPTTGTNSTARTRAWARFVQGLGHGLLALTYDQAFVLDVNSDPTALELKPYGEVMASALEFLDEAIDEASDPAFTGIKAEWFGGVALNQAQFIRLANSYQAYLRANVARTPTERAAVDWNAVIADVRASNCGSAGSCSDVEINADPNVWIHGTHYYVGFGTQAGAWAQLNYMVHGMADQSGAYQAWLATDVNARTPFLIITPDTRFPQGATATLQANNPGSDVVYGGTRGHVRGDRGTWRWSWYRVSTLDGSLGFENTSPLLGGRELRLLEAEGLFRTGNQAGAAAIVNETRTAAGLNATDAAGTNTSCVPRLPQGTCGDLLEMLKWEKRMESYLHSYGTWFFDQRGWGDLYQGTPIHWPVPAQELQVLGLPVYTFGGPGGYDNGASPGSQYAWPSEN